MRRNIKDYWDCVKELHYLSVGIVYFLHGQMPKAIELMKKATKLEDEDIFQKPDVFLTATLYYYSLMLAQTGDKYKADIYYMKAAKAGGKNNVFSQRAKGESNKFWKELGGGS